MSEFFKGYERDLRTGKMYQGGVRDRRGHRRQNREAGIARKSRNMVSVLLTAAMLVGMGCAAAGTPTVALWSWSPWT